MIQQPENFETDRDHCRTFTPGFTWRQYLTDPAIDEQGRRDAEAAARAIGRRWAERRTQAAIEAITK